MAAVLICDQPSATREPLAAKLAAVPGIQRVDWVDSPAQASAALAQVSYDLVLLSSSTPGADPAQAVAEVLAAAPGARVLMLTLGADPDNVARAVGAGAIGYLARDAAVPELAAALSAATVPQGQPPEQRPPIRGHELTERELQVLEGMSRGRSNSQIGTDLFLSEDTIKTHARRLFRKMEVNDRAHAVAEGLRRGLLS